MFSSACRVLTVIVHNVNGILIFREADGPAAGRAQQHHQGTEHTESHGWGQGTALLNYLWDRDRGDTACCTRGASCALQRWQQGTPMGIAALLEAALKHYWCLLIFSWIYGRFWRSWLLSAHLIHRIRKRTCRLLTWQEKLSNLGLEF